MRARTRAPGRRHLAATAAAALLLVLAGCGGGDDDAAGEAIAEGIVAANDPGMDDPSLVTEEQAGCIADALLADPGREALEDDGLLSDSGGYAPPDSAGDDVAAAWAAAHAGCLDLQAYLVGTVRVVADAVAEQPAGDEAWNEALACVRRDVPAADIEQLLVARATGAGAQSSPGDPFNACVADAAG